MKENTQKTKVKLERIIYEVTIDSVRTTKKKSIYYGIDKFLPQLIININKIKPKMKEHQLFLLH